MEKLRINRSSERPDQCAQLNGDEGRLHLEFGNIQWEKVDMLRAQNHT